MQDIRTLAQSVKALRRYATIVQLVSCLLFGVSLATQAQLTLTAGQSVSFNSAVTYPSVSISGANTALAIGSSRNVAVTGGFTWIDQPSYISIASGGILTIGGDFQGDGNTGINNAYYPCISSSGSTNQVMIVDCTGP